MTDHLAILDASAPSLSLEKAARSFYEERIPLAPPIPDRDLRWRWGVAIIAAILLHLAVITTIDDGFQREKPPQQAPIPVEIVTLPPKPPPAPKPVEKPPEQQKPPVPPQQPEPDRSSGGDLTDKAQGALPPAPAAEEKPPVPTPAPTPPLPEPPAPTPAPALPTPAPEPPAPTAAPALPTEPASPQAVPVPPAASPRDTQQALVPPPVPPKKPPAPPLRQVTTAAPPQTLPQPQAPATSPLQDLRLGEGGGDKYLNALRDDIRRHQFYPPTAELFRITGVATYDITIDRQGRLVNVQLVQSSGYDLLDKAGFMTIKLSAPFDPVPADFVPERDTIGLVLTLSMGPN